MMAHLSLQPWTRGTADPRVIYSADGYEVGQVLEEVYREGMDALGGPRIVRDDIEVEANARLWECAPRLLETLRGLIGLFQLLELGNRIQDPMAAKANPRYREALDLITHLDRDLVRS